MRKRVNGGGNCSCWKQPLPRTLRRNAGADHHKLLTCSFLEGVFFTQQVLFTRRGRGTWSSRQRHVLLPEQTAMPPPSLTLDTLICALEPLPGYNQVFSTNACCPKKDWWAHHYNFLGGKISQRSRQQKASTAVQIKRPKKRSIIYHVQSAEEASTFSTLRREESKRSSDLCLELRRISHDLQLLRDDMSLAFPRAQLASRLKVPLPPSPRHQHVSSNLDIKKTSAKRTAPKTQRFSWCPRTHTQAGGKWSYFLLAADASISQRASTKKNSANSVHAATRATYSY